MYKYQAKFQDFDGNQKFEDIYFHMMAPEIADLEFEYQTDSTNGFMDFVKDSLNTGDGRKVYAFFKLMIVKSYGRRSPDDASRFEKRPEWTREFLSSLAYENFFMFLVEDPANANLFFNGIMPQTLLEKAQAIEAQQSTTEKKPIQDMSKEEIAALMQKLIDSK